MAKTPYTQAPPPESKEKIEKLRLPGNTKTSMPINTDKGQYAKRYGRPF
jgi:hypothetical protein